MPLNSEEWASVTVPVQVVHGSKSPTVLKDGSRALAEVLSNAELRELEGVSHNLKMKALAPVLVDFLLKTGASSGARENTATARPPRVTRKQTRTDR